MNNTPPHDNGLPQYIVVRGRMDDIERSMDERIQQGYVCYGSLATGGNHWLYQAMVQPGFGMRCIMGDKK